MAATKTDTDKAKPRGRRKPPSGKATAPKPPRRYRTAGVSAEHPAKLANQAVKAGRIVADIQHECAMDEDKIQAAADMAFEAAKTEDANRAELERHCKGETSYPSPGTWYMVAKMLPALTIFDETAGAEGD